MKYVSIDIESTGLNHDICQVLEFAAIIDDLGVQAPIETLPTFQTYILQDHYIGEPYALAMHAEIFKKIANWKKNTGLNFCSPADLLPRFHTFLTTLGGYYEPNGVVRINVAGKNFGNFDSKFLEKLPHYNLLVRFGHRILDPATLYFDPNEDTELPSTEKCLERAGFKGEVKHTATEDAINVIKLLRKKYPRK
jgi:hypothetical protein